MFFFQLEDGGRERSDVEGCGLVRQLFVYGRLIVQYSLLVVYQGYVVVVGGIGVGGGVWVQDFVLKFKKYRYILYSGFVT